MSGIDQYTQILVHCNGTNGQTTFTDSSTNNRTVIVSGSAQISTAQYVFGNSSLLLGGSATKDCLQFASNSDFAPGSGDWSFDTRIRISTAESGFVMMFDLYQDATNRLVIYYTGATLNVFMGGSNVTMNWTPSYDTWYHIAVERDGTKVKAWIDGSYIGSASATDVNGTMYANIGRSQGDGLYVNGYMDEVRYCKGIARWTGVANFTPPAVEYNSFDTVKSPIASSSLSEDANLKYYWPFDGNSTGLIGGQNGTDSNITYQPSSKEGFVSASVLNSNADRIELGYVFAPRGINGTISSWILLTASGSVGDADYKITSWYTKGDVYGRLGVTNTNKVRVYCYDGVAPRYVDSSTALINNAWYHVVYTWNSTSGSIYINGLRETGSAAANMYNMDAGGDSGYNYVGLGPEVGALNYVFNGYVDEMAFFNRELSPSEILSLYNNIVPVTTIKQNLQMIL